jgi:hypothetical protein
MRRLVVSLIAFAVVACRSHTAPLPPSPVRVDSGTVTLTVPIDSLGRPAQAPPIPDSLLRQAMQRAESAAALVDTIVTRVDSLVLRVGQVLSIRPRELVEGRRANGEPVLAFAPAVRVENDRIARMERTGLVGVSPGRTRLLFAALSRGRLLLPDARRASLVVVVQP